MEYRVRVYEIEEERVRVYEMEERVRDDLSSVIAYIQIPSLCR